MLDIIRVWKEDNLFADPDEEALWNNAVKLFRLPYRDWARKQEYVANFGIPQICTLETVSIAAPGGKVDKDFLNPLIRFRNPKNIAMGDASMGEYAIEADDPNDSGTDKYHILPVSRTNPFDEIYSQYPVE